VSSRLLLYKGACRHLGETSLSALTDNVPIRYALDDVWDGGGVERCLDEGQWNFATRSSRLDHDPSITPDFGYPYAFEKPTDFVRTTSVCTDEFFNCPLREYRDELLYWWANQTPLFVRFVSKHNNYGMNIGEWPESFAAFAEAAFAYEVTSVATFASKRAETSAVRAELLLKAQSRDAMETPAPRKPLGSWASSRGGFGGGERGSTSRLIG
jgi:hypothetical protein